MSSSLQQLRCSRAVKSQARKSHLSWALPATWLYKWAAQLDVKAGNTQAAFNGPGRKLLAQQPEIEHLKRELARVTEERDILKKAAAYFARQLP